QAAAVRALAGIDAGHVVARGRHAAFDAGQALEAPRLGGVARGGGRCGGQGIAGGGRRGGGCHGGGGEGGGRRRRHGGAWRARHQRHALGRGLGARRRHRVRPRRRGGGGEIGRAWWRERVEGPVP